MAEYIERGVALAKIELDEYYHSNEIKDILQDVPAADVAPVRHGRWVADCDGISRCPFCWAAAPAEDEDGDSFGVDSPPYCHNCGAKMDGGENHA